MQVPRPVPPRSGHGILVGRSRSQVHCTTAQRPGTTAKCWRTCALRDCTGTTRGSGCALPKCTTAKRPRTYALTECSTAKCRRTCAPPNCTTAKRWRTTAFLDCTSAKFQCTGAQRQRTCAKCRSTGAAPNCSTAKTPTYDYIFGLQMCKVPMHHFKSRLYQRSKPDSKARGTFLSAKGASNASLGQRPRYRPESR